MSIVSHQKKIHIKMKEVEDFLQFILDHHLDDRIDISKKMKYGHRFYYITFHIDEEPEESKSGRLRITDSVEVCIDNRNNCIEVGNQHGYNTIVIENEELVKKWTDILEKYIEEDNKSKIDGLLEKTLSKCYNKNLYREYQMKKILPNNESL